MNINEYDKLSPSEAIIYQNILKNHIELRPLSKPISTIGGADISFNKNEETVYAGIIVLSYPDLRIIEQVTIIGKSTFPYISGLLAFREIPTLMEAYEKLKNKPDLLVLDGQGIAHRRKTGIASHFGILINSPTIGCGKSRLFGSYTDPENRKFAESPLMDKNERIGTVLRSKINCNPLFISPGNLITIEESTEIIKKCIGSYRIPEPTRLAHLLVNDARISAGEETNIGKLF
ncbi:deoxyribonuclease V [Pseudopedobacter sp.]|uniref:deoxyribonuclease V n=1 Tax=Pseudopedobacter sp. TaxID=1936787 RepID=UPI00333EF464